MIQGFVTDTAVISKANPLVALNDLTINCGYLDSELIEKFVNPVSIIDRRVSRLPITYRATRYINSVDPALAGYIDVSVVNQGNNLLIQSPDTTISYGVYTESADDANYSGEVLPTVATAITGEQIEIIFDSTKATATENSLLAAMTAAESEALFNIVEYILYGSVSTDMLLDINAALVADAVAYAGYVDGSLAMSDYRSTVALYGNLNIHRFAPRWFQFDILIGGVNVTFKLWYDRNDFRYLYPEYTVIEVIPPLDLNILVDPTTYLTTNPINAINDALRVNADHLAVQITSEDCTGYVGMTTRYVFDGVTYLLTFGILFKGRYPTIFEVRDIVINYLSLSGVGDMALWQLRFPDLFVDNQFFMVPIWNNSTILPNADIYPSIVSNMSEDTIVDTIMTGLVPNTQQYENITVAYDKFFVATLANVGNVVGSLKELHPTYQDYSSTEPEFVYMEADTQQFSLLLNNALAVASGELNNSSYSLININGREFLSVIHNNTEYLILTKAGFDALIV